MRYFNGGLLLNMLPRVFAAPWRRSASKIFSSDYCFDLNAGNKKINAKKLIYYDSG